MQSRTTEFESAGRTFTGELYLPPATSPVPGVLVLHGGAGRGDHERERASRLAELGYAAFVPDLFGEVLTDRARGVQVITALVDSPDVLRGRLTDALAHLSSRDEVDGTRVAAVGFCFGGLAALELARSGADVRCVASFHGGLTTRAPAREGDVRAAVLVATGAEDPFVPPEHRRAFEEEMRAAKVDFELCILGGAVHGFTEARAPSRPGVAYDARADRRSWSAMRALLEETLLAASNDRD